MDPVESLHPEMAEAVALVPLFDITPDILPLMRSVFPGPPLSDAVERTEHVVPGDPEITVRVHRPKGHDGPLPCTYAMHGGGYMFGTYNMDDSTFDERCPRVGMVGVSVEYRLAPETPYPGPLEDCYRGLQWVHENAAELGIDPGKIGVGGVSAGAGLAAALALLARDRGEVPVAFQLLDYPMLDDRQVTYSSQQEGLPVWSKGSNEFGWRSYLGELYGTDDVPYTASPARATVADLAGLPPAFVGVGSVDGFLDEDVAYALDLNRAGVPCELHVYPGAPHGYHMAPASSITKQNLRDVEEWLTRQFQA